MTGNHTFLLQLHVLGALVAAHLEEVRRRAHPVLPDRGEVVVRNALLLAELPAESQRVVQLCLTNRVQGGPSGQGHPFVNIEIRVAL